MDPDESCEPWSCDAFRRAGRFSIEASLQARFRGIFVIMRGRGACAHGIRLGECHAPGCPVWLGDPHGQRPWASGWALSRYSGAGPHDTRMGSLVHDVKYGRVPLDERRAMAEEVAERMMGFVEEAYELPRPFTVCVAPPSHQGKPLELAHFLCEELSEGLGLDNRSSDLHEREHVRSMKEIADAGERLALLKRAITVDAPVSDRNPRGFLIVDDVFDTGATATAICAVLGERFPRSRFHVLTATCVGG